MKVGILGAGQLGRMLALSGFPLGIQFRFFDPVAGSPASQFAEQIVGEYDDHDALNKFADGLDVITYEFENVPVDVVNWLSKCVPVYPSPAALEISQDRFSEKNLFRCLGIDVPPFRSIDSQSELASSVEELGLPAVLKTRRMGYDGKGQMVIRSKGDVEGAFAQLGSVPQILEAFVDFARELSIICVRSLAGDFKFYPLVQNKHEDGILRTSVAPAHNVSEQIWDSAKQIARLVAQKLDYVGTLAIELFDCNGKLMVNEMAPRVHNSGHWTIEGALTSQFENHIRAICGLPLGSAEPTGNWTMVNLIGELPSLGEILADPHAKLHLYGKSPRPGRKLGHVTTFHDYKPFEETISWL